jgi:hypothetical protein
MSKLKIETVEEGDDVIYNITVGKKSIAIHCNADNTFMLKGPKDIISKAIGGRGDEDETMAWIQDKDMHTSSAAIFSIVEIMKVMLEK